MHTTTPFLIKFAKPADKRSRRASNRWHSSTTAAERPKPRPTTVLTEVNSETTDET